MCVCRICVCAYVYKDNLMEEGRRVAKLWNCVNSVHIAQRQGEPCPGRGHVGVHSHAEL